MARLFVPISIELDQRCGNLETLPQKKMKAQYLAERVGISII